MHQATRGVAWRKLDNLNTCTHLTITDLAALRHLVRVYSELKPRRLFAAVTHLALGADVVRWLAFVNSAHWHKDIRALQRMISPTSVCFTYPTITQEWETLQHFNRIAAHSAEAVDDPASGSQWQFRGDLLARYQHLYGIANLVHDFVRAWRPRCVAVHGVGEQTLPETSESSPVKLRVFYVHQSGAQDSYALDIAQMTPRMLMMLEELRAREMAMRVSLLDGPEDCSFEFIGAGLIEDEAAGATSGEASGDDRATNDSECEPTVSRDETTRDPDSRIRELFWSQFTQPERRQVIEGQVRFVSRKEAEPCACCGGK